MALPTRRFPLTGPPREPSAHSPESDGPRFDFDDVRECGGDDDDTYTIVATTCDKHVNDSYVTVTYMMTSLLGHIHSPLLLLPIESFTSVPGASR
ncbi:Hypothetical protein SMAX5B_009174 [Scophthalmus maximus]|uniref:Uncharacterized protein n=1 Tax=Scophthalmus maximus TaxID=52904 RepID=A0A2U9C9Q4_SCOMX|nr:Hypothetical protein SMAX5B_009174 [Scophthalmus maximus]